MRITRSACALTLTATLLACNNKQDDQKPRNAPPPPTPSASVMAADLCAQGGGTLADATLAPMFPRTVGGYCIDPGFDLKTFGEKGKLPIQALCETALDGGCEEYKKAGVTRAAMFHYAQSKGAGSVEVLVSQFPGDAAFGVFTTRLVGDLDPADPSMMKPLADVAMGAIGTGKAYVWRGPYFLELTYTNDQETPADLARSSAIALGSLAKEISSKLPSTPDVPAAAKALPTADRLPLGTLYYTKDALGQGGLGAAASGFYQAGEVRWRTIVIAKADAEQAKDVMRTLAKKPGALPVASLGDEAVQVALTQKEGAPKADYVFARKGATVIGVADEELAPEHKLSKDDKVAKVRAQLK